MNQQSEDDPKPRMNYSVNVPDSKSVADLIRAHAKRSCKKCYGTGFAGTILHSNGSREKMTCKCVHKNEAFKKALRDQMEEERREAAKAAEVRKAKRKGDEQHP